MKNNIANDNEKPAKKAKLKLRPKREANEKISEKERKATIKALNGSFGRMDKILYDDIQ